MKVANFSPYKFIQNMSIIDQQEVIHLPKYALSLLTYEGYFKRFNEIYTNSQAKAWEALEVEMWGLLGIGKFNTFNSFKKGLKHSRMYIANEKAKRRIYKP
jgi:hypothetical protein